MPRGNRRYPLATCHTGAVSTHTGEFVSVLSLNLWHDSGPYEARRKLLQQWIERLDPDVIGFQEALRGPGFDQVAELLGDTEYHVEYAAASTFWRDAKRAPGHRGRHRVRQRRGLALADQRARRAEAARRRRRRDALGALGHRRGAPPDRALLGHLHPSALEVPPLRGAAAPGDDRLRPRALATAPGRLPAAPARRPSTPSPTRPRSATSPDCSRSKAGASPCSTPGA